MIIDKEFLDFALEAFAQVVDALDVRVTVIAAFDRRNAIVTLPLLFGALFAFADIATPETITPRWLPNNLTIPGEWTGSAIWQRSRPNTA